MEQAALEADLPVTTTLAESVLELELLAKDTAAATAAEATPQEAEAAQAGLELLDLLCLMAVQAFLILFSESHTTGQEAEAAPATASVAATEE